MFLSWRARMDEFMADATLPSGMQKLRVPASSANLGPGFDALGLGLDLYLECDFCPASALTIRASGRDAAMISTGDDNLIWKTAVQVAQEAGCQMPPVELEIRNDIPLGKGLGSSAAALTAGVVIANQVLNLGWDKHKVLNVAAVIEGHPDNVAACVLGAIVASAVDSEGRAQAVRMNLDSHYSVAVVVPDYVLPTSEARRVLPATYSRADAVFNVQRSALLIVALATGTTSAFPTALEDRMHQPYRLPLVPGLEEVVKLRAPGLLGCALSGAGPSILVFHERGHEQVCELVREVFARHGRKSEIVCRGIAQNGYSLE
ncbi:MAG: homoserine kinase [Acidobacteriota bacterium]